MNKLKKNILLNPNAILILYTLLAIIASLQLILLDTHFFDKVPVGVHDHITSNPGLFLDPQTSHFNNYRIFKSSFFHLVAGKNLYDSYPHEHFDYFKYSPTFALFMGILSYLPNYIGFSLWSIFNALAVYAGVRLLPFTMKTKCFILWFIALELLTEFQNQQSNGLLCGFILIAYGFMERGKLFWASLFLVAVTFIKVYGAVGFCLFLFYPQKYKAAAYSIFFTVISLAAPLLVTSFNTLLWQYQNWKTLILADRATSLGLSVMGWLHSWFGFSINKSVVTLAGVLLFLMQFTRLRLYKNKIYRLMMLASLLIWVIIFNHKAESPTYIIAVTGVAIWYYSSPVAAWRTILLWFVFVFTCMSVTDIFPPIVKSAFFIPYTIKAFPCIVTWCVVFAEIILMKHDVNQTTARGFSTYSLINGKEAD